MNDYQILEEGLKRRDDAIVFHKCEHRDKPWVLEVFKSPSELPRLNISNNFKNVYNDETYEIVLQKIDFIINEITHYNNNFNTDKFLENEFLRLIIQ